MGVSLLGLASQMKAQYIKNNSCAEMLSLDLEKHNFIGVDLSRLGIRYADGVCTRWGLDGQLHFIVDSAEACLCEIRESYPGDVVVSVTTNLAIHDFVLSYMTPLIFSLLIAHHDPSK